jgi:flagellar biosynthesis protein FlgN
MITKLPEQLIVLIQTLESLSSQLNDTLTQEQASLSSNDSQQLLALSKDKKALVSNLEKQTKTTHVFLINMSIKQGLYGLSDFFSQIKPSLEKTSLHDAWLNIQALSEENKKINNANGSIIELNRRHTQRSLDVLRGQTSTTNSTYGSDGQAMKTKTSQNISVA